MAANSSVVSMASKLNDVDPEDVHFRLFTDEDVRKLSVAKITSIVAFDLMGNPVPGGLYDLRMGPTRDWQEICGTCNKTQMYCNGHFGHIELPVVTSNPLFMRQIYTLLRISCMHCHKIQLTDTKKTLLKMQLALIDAGHITAALDVQTYFAESMEMSTDRLKKVLKPYKKLLAIPDPVTDKFKNKNSSVVRGRILSNYIKVMNVTKTCLYCKQRLVKVSTSDNKLMHNYADEKGSGKKIMMPDEIKKLCAGLAEANEDILNEFIPILKQVTVKPATDAFFMEVIPVPPPVVRPCNVVRGVLNEHPQSNVYKAILFTSLAVRTALKIVCAPDSDMAINMLEQEQRHAYESAYGTTPTEKLHNAWQDLQKNVINILDCEGGGLNIGGSNSIGIKQVIEKKTGVIRMHMMGKRVNFAARSVITPDPNVDIDEIGIPDAFATKLTYPVYVTPWNVDELRQMVINGPNKHPGADKIEIENGRIIKIPEDSHVKRKSLAKRLLTPDEYQGSSLKIVHRHLQNGDVLILNRQPSLHKPSMMAHRARILKGEKTLRLHYANCKSYNADFDGDEMNAHFPQNEIAKSEAINIMSVRKQYLVPKDGTPLSGLIQDHVISGVRMSLRGTFFTKSDYQQLVFQGLANHKGEIKLLPPTILKPVMLWSGKQVLSTIIMNNIPKGKPYLSLNSNAKINAKAWQKEQPRTWKAGGTSFNNPNTMTEAEVIIKKGELISGVLDKTHYGATPYGLVHCMYELYGGDSSSALLSSFSKLFTYYLQWIGFTLGVKDILVVPEADKERDQIIENVRRAGIEAAAKATELPDEADEYTIKEHIEDNLIKDPKFRAHLDRQYKTQLDSFTNKINTVCLTHGLLEKFPYNNLQLMVQSGAKGSTVNTMQISCLLGQIELEGKRPPLMISGKSLPSFPAYDLSPRAGGFIDGRFMTGIQPQEFFFHCMAGREGLIDTAVKTSRSGYLQRCLIKHLEGLSIGYDHTVRDSDSSVIQFAYGEDGLDVLKCQFMKEGLFKFLDENATAAISKSTLKALKENADTKSVQKILKSIDKWKKKNGDALKKRIRSAFSTFSSTYRADIRTARKFTPDTEIAKARDKYYYQYEKVWRDMDEDQRKEHKYKICPEPLQSKMSPEFKFGVINEQLESLIQKYLKNRKESIYSEYTEKEKFVEVLNAKYLASMADPGEPVGLLAAQSIGEPSTQMTLNTFHFAGRGDMNVTLGIPRLREILMTASANLKTPNMDIPFRPYIQQKRIEKLRNKLNRVCVADVLEKIEVKCEVLVAAERRVATTMRFHFLPHSQYKSIYCVKPENIIKHMETRFFKELFTVIRKQEKTFSGIVWSDEKEAKSANRLKKKDDDDDDEGGKEKEVPAAAIDSSDDEEPNEDNDNTDAKLRSKRAEEQEYEDPESEEEEKDENERYLEQEEENAEMKKELKKEQKQLTDEEERNAERVVEAVKYAKNYKFDSKKHSWCELTLNFPIKFLSTDLTHALKETAARSVIHEVKLIKRAITVQEKDVLTLKTEGINIVEMFKYNRLLELNKLYSNDVHAIANTYGIEAATRVIKQEIQNVFNVYGITVDPRHLSLISDYMTFNGRFEPMSRKGMEASCSPLQQMSFESSMVYLRDAVLGAKSDELHSASSRLMLGQPCWLGSGIFGLQHSRQEFL